MSLAFFNNLDEMLHRADHAAHRRRIFQRARAANLAEAEAAQRRFLLLRLARRTLDLTHGHGFLRGHYLSPAGVSAFEPSRREMISATLRPRRCAIMRGDCWDFSASNVARTML